MGKHAVWGLWLAFGLIPFAGQSEGATEPAAANHADARALAAADFDEDGTPDLICGFAVGESGMVTLRPGNVKATYPNSEKDGATESFLAERRSFATPAKVDFLRAGDLDADGHWIW